MCYLNKSDTPAVVCIINPVKQNVIKRRSLTVTSAERPAGASEGISLEGHVGEKCNLQTWSLSERGNCR